MVIFWMDNFHIDAALIRIIELVIGGYDIANIWISAKFRMLDDL